MQECLSIDFHTISTHQHYSPPLLTKSRQKCVILRSKSLLLTKKQLYTIYFFLATCSVCPLAIPESLAHNVGLWLLANHSLIPFIVPQICISATRRCQRLPRSTSISTFKTGDFDRKVSLSKHCDFAFKLVCVKYQQSNLHLETKSTRTCKWNIRHPQCVQESVTQWLYKKNIIIKDPTYHVYYIFILFTFKRRRYIKVLQIYKNVLAISSNNPTCHFWINVQWQMD